MSTSSVAKITHHMCPKAKSQTETLALPTDAATISAAFGISACPFYMVDDAGFVYSPSALKDGQNYSLHIRHTWTCFCR